MTWTDDPVADYMRYDAEQQKELEKYPICSRCEEPIVQEDAVKIGNDWYCDRCLDEMREYISEDDDYPD